MRLFRFTWGLVSWALMGWQAMGARQGILIGMGGAGQREHIIAVNALFWLSLNQRDRCLLRNRAQDARI